MMDHVQILNTTLSDGPLVQYLFNEAMRMQGKNGYKVWATMDHSGLESDIENQLQYKVLKNEAIVGIYSIQYKDPFIWRNRDKNDALYLHRIVVHPNFKGQRLFEKILSWTIAQVKTKDMTFIRMDTWADNHQLIKYYKSFGFRFIENYRTGDIKELPIQNRNLNLSLLELKVN